MDLISGIRQDTKLCPMEEYVPYIEDDENSYWRLEQNKKPEVPFFAEGNLERKDGTVLHMKVQYAEDATRIYRHVTVMVTDQDGVETEYQMDIADVDTAHATEIEMFALCSCVEHERDSASGAEFAGVEKVKTGTLSTWESLSYYRKLAEDSGYEMSEVETAQGGEQYNWREMVTYMALDYKEYEMYAQYLHIDRMRDMMDFYTHEWKPFAFGDSFYAYRKFPSRGMESLSGGIYIFTEQRNDYTGREEWHQYKKIECWDYSGYPARLLWKRDITPEESPKMDTIRWKEWKPYMDRMEFWDGFLTENINPADYTACTNELMRQSQNDEMFRYCPDKVERAWKSAQSRMKFRGLGVNEEGEVPKYAPEYLKLMLEQVQKGKSPYILGTTIDEAIDMAKRALENIEHMTYERLNYEYEKQKLREKAFYYEFLDILDETREYDPVQRLLGLHYGE